MLKKIKIGSDINNLRVVENAIDVITSRAGVNQDNYGKILVSILEAVNNAIIHGNKSIAEKFVEIKIIIKENLLQVTVTDEGKGFSPEKVADPTLPENIELTNGRGIFLMSKLADEIEYNKKGNSVKLTFKNLVS